MNVEGLEINKVFILQSLNAGDKMTGTILYNHIKDWDDFVVYEPVEICDRDSLFTELQTIYESIGSDDGLIIDLECHGSPAGICLNNDDFVEWCDLKGILTQINIHTKMGLIIANSSCWGGHFSFQASLTSNSPYFLTWGPNYEVGEILLEDTNLSIFDGMKCGIPIDDVLNGINSSLPHKLFYKLNAYDLLVNAFKAYIDDSLSPQNLLLRADNIVAQTGVDLDSEAGQSLKTTCIAELINKEKLEGTYNKFRDRFLLTLENPELFVRFHTDFNEIFTAEVEEQFITKIRDHLDQIGFDYSELFE